MVPPASHRIPRVLWYSGYRLYFVVSFTGLLPSLARLSSRILLRLFRLRDTSTPINRSSSVWPLASSLAATKAIDFSFFSSGYLDVSVRRVPSCMPILFSMRCRTFHTAGSPIRISADITPVCGSPQLFAAYHVLLRQLVPGHPPCALSSLICSRARLLSRARYSFAFQL